MSSVPGVDHPEEQSEADVTLVHRGISVSSRVELVTDGVVVVRPSVGEYADQAVATVGDKAEVFWKGEEETRMVPAEVLSVETGAVVRWRLGITGEAEVSQRRKAVRGRVKLAVEGGHGSSEMPGETIDLSENGMRVLFDGAGLLPEPGEVLDLLIKLEDDAVKTRGEVVRVQTRGVQWLMSIRFVDLAEKDGDRFRRRVFQALREERARQSD